MNRLINHGIVEVAAIAPSDIEVADPAFNVDRMLELVKAVSEKNRSGERHTRVVVFPELSLTGYNCAELFNQSALLDISLDELERFVKASKDAYNPLIIIGAPLRKDNQLFNCAVVIHEGKILGVVPKTYLPNYTVLYEARYFHPSTTRLSDEIELFGQVVPFTPELLFEDKTSGAVVSAELCEDLWMPLAPSAYHCVNGSNIVANLSSSNQVFGKTEFRQELLRVHSAILACGYIYTCASDAESTTDSAFAGHNAIADNGGLTGETKFMDRVEITYGEVDIDKITVDRIRSNTYMSVPVDKVYKKVPYESFKPVQSFKSSQKQSILPFVPAALKDGYKDVLELQVTGLAKRLQRNKCNKVALEVSDSNEFRLALVATYMAFELSHFSPVGIQCVMDEKSFLDAKRLEAVKKLIEGLGATIIGKNSLEDSVVRLGMASMTDFCLNTTSEDYIKAYEVNASVPKTAINSLLAYFGKKHGGDVEDLLIALAEAEFNYVDTYDSSLDLSILVYDFIAYNMLAKGFGPKKIYDLLICALDDILVDKEDVLSKFKTFYSAFFESDFNRRRPDSVKVYPATLAVKDWRMPSNASGSLWLRALETL